MKEQAPQLGQALHLAQFSFSSSISPLKLGRIHAQLFQGEQTGAGGHGAPGDHHGGDVHPGQAHQVAGQALVAAGHIDAGVEGGGVGLNLDHVGDHLPACQGEVDAVGALALAVAHVGAEVPGAVAAGLGHPSRAASTSLSRWPEPGWLSPKVLSMKI